MEQDRFRLEWVSASEGTKFQRVVTEAAGKLKELGPRKAAAAPPGEAKAAG